MKKLVATGAAFALTSASAVALAIQHVQGADALYDMTYGMIFDMQSSGDLSPGDIDYVGGGSNAGANALIAGWQSIAPMTRRLSGPEGTDERGRILDAWGSYTEYPFGLDAAFVYVRGDQLEGDVAPVQSSVDQLKILFSGDGTGSDAACAARTIRNFEDLRDPSTTRTGRIKLYRPSDPSGGYPWHLLLWKGVLSSAADLFKSLVGITDFCPDVQKVRDCWDPDTSHGDIIEPSTDPFTGYPCSATDQLLERTSKETAAMALIGVGGLDPYSRNAPLAVASAFGGTYVAATPDNVAAFCYPLSRRLWLNESGHPRYPGEAQVSFRFGERHPDGTWLGTDFYLGAFGFVVCPTDPTDNACENFDLQPGDPGVCSGM
jgi:hypothetical protein